MIDRFYKVDEQSTELIKLIKQNYFITIVPKLSEQVSG